MRKVLIYYDKNELKPVGGPSGYLYNLSIVLNEVNNKIKIEFLKIKVIDKSKFKTKIKKILLNKPFIFIKGLYLKYKISSEIKQLSKNEGLINLTDLSKYDIVHFHTTKDMFECRKYLDDFSGKVLLTSHSPKAFHQELVDKLNLNSKKQMKKYLNMIEKVDVYAFNRADYIIFPTEESEECYFNTWDKYEEIHRKKIDKYKYIPTGIVPIDTSKFSKENIRKEYNIPNDAFVVCYVGRHNEIKGYDQLKLIANEVLKKNKNIYFLIAGKEEPIKGLDNERWIEVGWTNRAHEIIYSSDLFILPNKETYFDLILLEVMSIGKPVLLTNTGGNKYFKKFTKSGLFYYNYGDNSFAINEIIKLSKEKDLFKKGDLNKKIFLNNFTIDIFTNNYLKVLENIYNEKNK